MTTLEKFKKIEALEFEMGGKKYRMEVTELK